jgi:hypothetical protein
MRFIQFLLVYPKLSLNLSTALNEWISRVSRRWRAQRIAIRDANCRNSWVIFFLNAIGTWAMSSSMNEGVGIIKNKSNECEFRSRLSLERHPLTNEYNHSFSPPPFIQDYPPNLSISISGGKETNWDTLSNGEWRGFSPTSKGRKSWCGVCRGVFLTGLFDLWNRLEHRAMEGESPVTDQFTDLSDSSFSSRAIWEYSSNWVVKDIQD